ncbi:GntR family transcriptional regulator [Streptomyces sp. NBC_00237]|uniref:GntR family transcriptional regulator n=1 Tax=Streptomyces sp. NBC_00237 TaxID=2975687 RepID=UPI002252568B|nr:GntR family transcriptional regulator [Streptomyces sp. NBC_00237]MCX5203001.1 GntR family transcriptional regulator [Streptomyces sp. NBC_00237]
MPGEKTFTKISDHFRQRIMSGELEPGSKLPTNRDICGSWQTSAATVSRALQALQVEGYIRATPRGTFVEDNPVWTLSAADRLARVQRVKSFLADGETSRVTAASLMKPPLYVADILDLEHGDQAVRREYIAGRGQTRTVFAVMWYPAPFAALVPDLLNTAPGRNHGLTAKVLEATGRKITHARDDMHARHADAREASALGLEIGAPILAGAHRWSDAEGIIEYGEWCLPPRMTIGYEYQP